MVPLVRLTDAAPPVSDWETSMADINVREEYETDPEPDYTAADMILWLVGILAIPLVPILMVWLLTPWSGM
jgi:hypothetical protein